MKTNWLYYILLGLIVEKIIQLTFATLALALGVFSSGSQVFEVVYVLLWYLGPLQETPGMDFTAGALQVFLLAAAVLLLSVYWRGRQVRVERCILLWYKKECHPKDTLELLGGRMRPGSFSFIVETDKVSYQERS